ncbi:CcdB family protein [Polynucleobacter brandtiae]|uniref:Toxin CcdB n=1 Tax=Polynucleobacter brandtiae TaxID=1938816 RepID=A0A2M8VHC2_9BURK|nr:CcdB family protein [Polynucleobacter brandtiae]PJI76130.1 toxin CcdB [Polynucleobacter brandtiae]
MQFDVFENPSPRMRDVYPFVIDIQSNLLSLLATRMVIPVSITKLSIEKIPRRLCPLINIDGKKLMLMPHEAAPLDKKILKRKIGSAKSQSSEILSAMDAVTSGI